MRNLSCFHTRDGVLWQYKLESRRLGWLFVKPGHRLQPVVKGQGIPKGGHVEKLGCPVVVVAAERVRLDSITPEQVAQEGFIHMQPDQFVTWFCKAMHCTPDTIVTRIVWRYTVNRAMEIASALRHVANVYTGLQAGTPAHTPALRCAIAAGVHVLNGDAL